MPAHMRDDRHHAMPVSLALLLGGGIMGLLTTIGLIIAGEGWRALVVSRATLVLGRLCAGVRWVETHTC